MAKVLITSRRLGSSVFRHIVPAQRWGRKWEFHYHRFPKQTIEREILGMTDATSSLCLAFTIKAPDVQ